MRSKPEVTQMELSMDYDREYGAVTLRFVAVRSDMPDARLKWSHAVTDEEMHRSVLLRPQWDWHLVSMFIGMALCHFERDTPGVQPSP